MQVELTPRAKKQLTKLSKFEAKKVTKKLHALENFPLMGKKLKGELSNRYSLKTWPYRIIYVIEKNKIQVDSIKHRQQVYK